MAFLEDLIQEKGADWIRLLVEKAGMQQGQAESFLPVAANALLSLLQGGKLDLSALLGGADLGSLLKQLDLGSLAKAAGVDESTASAGAEQLGPELLGALKDRAGGGGVEGLLGALSGDASSGDLLGAASSLGKKLFG